MYIGIGICIVYICRYVTVCISIYVGVYIISTSRYLCTSVCEEAETEARAALKRSQEAQDLQSQAAASLLLAGLAAGSHSAIEAGKCTINSRYEAIKYHIYTYYIVDISYKHIK